MDFVWLAIILCALSLMLVAVFVVSINRRLLVVEKNIETQVESLKHELDMVSSAAIGVGQRLINVEKKLNVSIEKQQQLEMNSADNTSYTQAAALVDSGADIDELIDSCGLPEAEASLLALLKKKASQR